MVYGILSKLVVDWLFSFSGHDTFLFWNLLHLILWKFVEIFPYTSIHFISFDHISEVLDLGMLFRKSYLFCSINFIHEMTGFWFIWDHFFYLNSDSIVVLIGISWCGLQQLISIFLLTHFLIKLIFDLFHQESIRNLFLFMQLSILVHSKGSHSFNTCFSSRLQTQVDILFAEFWILFVICWKCYQPLVFV